MKKIIYILSIAVAVFVVGSCQKASADKTLETEYFTLNGDMAMYVEMGDPYVEPGYTPCEGASDVEVYIIDPNGSLVDEVDTSESGFYQIVYCNTSKEGFYFEKSRMVYVYDPTIEVDMAGGYSLDAKTSLFAGDTYLEYAQYYSDQSNFDPSVQAWARAPFVTPSVSITISKVAGNIYSVSDLIGGWYTSIQGRGGYYVDLYQSGAYATYFDMTGNLILNADMSVTLLSSFISAWKDGLDYLKNGVYDPETKTLTYDTCYAGGQVGPMHIVIKQE